MHIYLHCRSTLSVVKERVSSLLMYLCLCDFVFCLALVRVLNLEVLGLFILPPPPPMLAE